MSTRITAKERKEAERVAANARFLAALSDDALATVEADFFCEGDPVLTEQIATERAARRVGRCEHPETRIEHEPRWGRQAKCLSCDEWLEGSELAAALQEADR